MEETENAPDIGREDESRGRPSMRFTARLEEDATASKDGGGSSGDRAR